MTDPVYHLATVPPGTVFTRMDEPDPFTRILEWTQPDGEIHVMTIRVDASAPAGVRVDEVVCKADTPIEIGLYGAESDGASE